LAVPLFLVLCGCGTPTFSGGASARAAHQLRQDGRWAPEEGKARAGGGVDLRWHFLAKRDDILGGLAVGLEEAWMPVTSHSWRGRRENVLLSWSRTPRQDGYRGPLGYELTFVPFGWGHIETAGDIESAYTWGGRAGLLYKLPFWNDECGNSLVAWRTLLVLQGGWNQHHPIDAPNAPTWLGEGLATLGLRFDASVLP